MLGKFILFNVSSAQGVFAFPIKIWECLKHGLGNGI